MSLRNKTFLLRIFFLSAFIQSSILQAQEIGIDTSGYIPYYYSDAYNFNLLVASSNGYTSEIKRLVSMGADIEAKTDEGATPLILAVSGNKFEAVIALISLYADVNTSTNKWDSPLLLAARNGSAPIAEALIRSGAEINRTDFEGASALHYASLYGYIELTDMLIYYGADLNSKAVDGTTPLMAAVWSGYNDVADLLIQNGADVKIADNQGFTTFQVAAQTGDTTILRLLSLKGADKYKVNIFGWDALASSIRFDNTLVQEMILSEKDIKMRSTLAVNPYNVAAKYSRKESLSLLEKYNYPGRYSPGFDQVAIAVSGRFSTKDFYSSLSLSFTEPLWRAGFIAGLDTKLWPTRVLKEYQDNVYLQVKDKSSFAYAGIFKEMQISDENNNGNLYFTANICFGRSFGNRFPGTDMQFEGKWHIVPAAGLKYTFNMLNVFGNAEYLRSEFHKAGTVWFRTGVSVNLYFDDDRAPGKVIKWF